MRKTNKNGRATRKNIKIDAIIQNILLITLNVNKLNTPVKRLRFFSLDKDTTCNCILTISETP